MPNKIRKKSLYLCALPKKGLTYGCGGVIIALCENLKEEQYE